MSADSTTDGLARFDTRQRTARDDQNSHQTDLRDHGVRERDQLALNELSARNPRASQEEQSTESRFGQVERDRLSCQGTGVSEQ